MKLAEDEFYAEERRQRLEDKEQNNDFFASISTYGSYDVFDPHDAQIAASKVIAQLKSGKTDQIEKAHLQIKADLPSPKTILAVVYETGSKYRELDKSCLIWKSGAVAFSRITTISKMRVTLM